MLIAALVLAGLASLLHVYIFVLESLRWEHQRTRETFGTTLDEARTTRALAYNQGFYNLFLAIVTTVGIVLVAAGHTGVGAALVLAGNGSMVLAAVVLVTSSRQRLRAALVQGTFPVVAVLLLTGALLN